MYVNSFPEPGRKYRVSIGSGFFPVWGAGGKEVIYTRGDRTLERVPVQTEPEFRAGAPETMFRRADGSTDGTLATDGKRFLDVRQTGPAPAASITVVLNWVNEVEE